MKQLLPDMQDLKTWGLIVDRYPNSFGSGPDDPHSIGLSGEAWVMIPIDAGGLKLMWEATGMDKNSDESGYRLIDQYADLKVQFKAIKMKAGLFRKPFWIVSNQFLFERNQIVNAGFFCVRTLLDIPRVIDGFMDGDLSPKPSATEASAGFTMG